MGRFTSKSYLLDKLNFQSWQISPNFVETEKSLFIRRDGHSYNRTRDAYHGNNICILAYKTVIHFHFKIYDYKLYEFNMIFMGERIRMRGMELLLWK
jgi:hypothetical protein